MPPTPPFVSILFTNNFRGHFRDYRTVEGFTRNVINRPNLHKMLCIKIHNMDIFKQFIPHINFSNVEVHVARSVDTEWIDWMKLQHPDIQIGRQFVNGEGMLVDRDRQIEAVYDHLMLTDYKHLVAGDRIKVLESTTDSGYPVYVVEDLEGISCKPLQRDVMSIEKAEELQKHHLTELRRISTLLNGS